MNQTRLFLAIGESSTDEGRSSESPQSTLQTYMDPTADPGAEISQARLCDNEYNLLLDSGASHHMVRNRSLMSNVQTIHPKSIVLGNGNIVQASRKGTITVRAILKYQSDTFVRYTTLYDVLHVPELETDLVSVSSLCDSGYDVNFGPSGRCVALRNGTIFTQGKKIGDLYYIRGSIIGKESSKTQVDDDSDDGHTDGHNDSGHGLATQAVTLNERLWHARLGYADIQSIRRLARIQAVRGLDLSGTVNKSQDCSD